MGYVVRMPKLGLEMSSGTVTRWVVDEGESVERGDVLAEVESEKAAAEVEAREDGVLRRRVLDETEAVEPGDPLGILAGADEDISPLEAQVDDETAAPDSESEPATTASSDESSDHSSAATTRDESSPADDPKASPRAKRRAADLGVDLTTVEGTGPQGSITEADVVAAAAVDGEPTARAGRTTDRPLSGMRETIADRLGKSSREAVHVTEHRTVDAEAALAAADAAAETFSADVSVTDVLLRALSAALVDHPEFNATFEADVHRLHEQHNLCVAVDVDEGLVAPVVRDVRSDHVVDIAEKRARATELARSGDYTMDDLSGGTFTVTNLGVFGVESFDPVINPPQVAILGVNAIGERPAKGDDGSVVFRRTLPLDLSFDHRVVDGADAARFLDTLVGHLEEPWPLLEGVDRREATPVELPERRVSASVGPELSGSIAAGSFEYDFDVTEQFGGGGAPTPVDLFLGAFAACLSASIGVQADIRDVVFDDITVDVDGTPDDGSVESIAIHVSVATDADDAIVDRIVTNGERTCHVAELLREDLPVEVTWERA
jgi:pyruvate dehydrogenase E2 component (dihydrolipoamide acetyltransferase)